MLAVILVSLDKGGTPTKVQEAISASAAKYRYGMEMHVRSGMAAKSEKDLIELIERAKANDELSIRQMIVGGRAWIVPAGSRRLEMLA